MFHIVIASAMTMSIGDDHCERENESKKQAALTRESSSSMVKSARVKSVYRAILAQVSLVPSENV